MYRVEKRGFILIEALSALSMIIIFCGTFLLWHMAIARMQEDAKQRLRAQTYATYYAEKVRAGAIPAGFVTTHQPFTITVLPYQVAKAPKGLSLAQVVVKWQNAYDNKRSYEILTGVIA